MEAELPETPMWIRSSVQRRENKGQRTKDRGAWTSRDRGFAGQGTRAAGRSRWAEQSPSHLHCMGGAFLSATVQGPRRVQGEATSDRRACILAPRPGRSHARRSVSSCSLLHVDSPPSNTHTRIHTYKTSACAQPALARHRAAVPLRVQLNRRPPRRRSRETPLSRLPHPTRPRLPVVRLWSDCEKRATGDVLRCQWRAAASASASASASDSAPGSGSGSGRPPWTGLERSAGPLCWGPGAAPKRARCVWPDPTRCSPTAAAQ